MWTAGFKCSCNRRKRQHKTSSWIRGRQSPASVFRPSGPRRLVSFNIKFGPENVPDNEQLFSRWAWYSRTLIVNADRLYYTRWRWLTPFTRDPSVTSLVKLGHFWWSWKNSIKLKTGGVDLKSFLNKIPKISTFPLSAFADMTWHHDEGGWASPQLLHFSRKIYLLCPQQVPWGLIRPSTPKSLPTLELDGYKMSVAYVQPGAKRHK